MHVLAGTHSRTANEMSMASDVFSLVTTEIVVVHVFVESIDYLLLLLLLAKEKRDIVVAIISGLGYLYS